MADNDRTGQPQKDKPKVDYVENKSKRQVH